MKDTIKIPNKGKNNTKFIAHRGLSGLEAQNTAASFIAAGNRTYYGVETDIWKTADNQYVCCHDETTQRFCDVDLKIEESTLAELRALQIRDRDGVADRAELIFPTLQEYLKICKKYGKVCVTELKAKFTDEEIEEIIEIFEKEEYLENTIFISFLDNVQTVKRLRPNQRCQWIHWINWTDDLPEKLSGWGIGLDIAGGGLTEERVAACHAAGVEVNVWTIDKPEDAETFVSWGVDYITTNILE